MVGHFLQQNRRNQSSLSQSANTNPDFSNGNISTASTSASSSFSSTNSGPIDANLRSNHQQYQNATIYADAAMSSSNGYGYNGNGGGSNSATNGSHPHHQHYPQQQQMGMKSNNGHEGYPPAHYTPPQNLTAEAVAALPPPGALERALQISLQ